MSAGVVVVLLASCSSIEAEPDEPATTTGPTSTATSEPEAVVEEETPPVVEAPVAPVSGVARAEQTPEQVSEAQDLYLVMVSTLETGAATDEQTLAAGGQACDVFDAGGDLRLAGSFTVLELPTDLPDEAYFGTAYAAARSLCPEHQAMAQIE